jgi:hypothetical protein
VFDTGRSISQTFSSWTDRTDFPHAHETTSLMYQALQPTSFQIARKEYRVVLKILATHTTVILYDWRDLTIQF